MKKNQSLVLALLLSSCFFSSSSYADITGTVFEDNNLNGIFDSGSGEVGRSGVTVQAFDSDDPLATPTATTTSGVGGVYTLSGLSNAISYRIEFGNLPNGQYSSPFGTDSQTSVGFATDPTIGFDFGIVNPLLKACSTTDAQYMVTQFNNGDPNDGSSTGDPAISRFAYTDRGEASPTTRVQSANVDDVGSVWGLAYDRLNGSLYMSTLLKRHAGLMQDGGGNPLTGAIYRQTDPTDPATASLFYDFGAAVGNDIPTNAARFPSVSALEGPAKTQRSVDGTVYSMIGKRGFGDIDLSDDGKTLYAVNLFDRKLYTVDTTTPAHVEVASAPWLDNSICPANADASASGVARPWAVKYDNDNAYVGVVCDASSSDSCDATNACSDLTAHIFAHDGTSWSTVLPTPIVLDYERDFQGYTSAGEYWHPWTDDYTSISTYVTNAIRKYPQPILGDIEFADDGSLILGFIDRTTHQFGFANSEPNVATANTITYIFSAGDVLRVGFDATGTTLTLENNGQTYDSSGTLLTGASTDSPTGPGGREFYDDRWQSSGFATAAADTAVGSLAVLPGSNEMIYTSADRYSYYSAATVFASNTDGSHTGGATVYQDDGSGNLGTFSKGGGLGDIEILCPRIPLEVGNRVWSDDDGDGVQDADETGIANVSVQLTCGAQSATTTTNGSGQYLFTDDQGDIATWTNGMIPRDIDCTVAISESDASLGSLTLTNADQAGANDAVDSDGSSSGGNAIVNFRTGDAGQNNHSYDFGFRNAPTCAINAPTVSAQCNNNGTASDPSDDVFTYTINATGTDVGATYSISGGDTAAGISYGADYTSTNTFPIASGDISLTLTDVDTASCTLGGVIATAPATCSNVIPQTDVSLVKTANPTQALSGETVIYTLTASNNGPNDATNVVVSDPLPAGVTYVSDDGGVATSESGGTVTWTVGSLAVGVTVNLNITVTID